MIIIVFISTPINTNSLENVMLITRKHETAYYVQRCWFRDNNNVAANCSYQKNNNLSIQIRYKQSELNCTLIATDMIYYIDAKVAWV